MAPSADFFWALGVVLLFWIIPVALTLVPSYELQTLGVILCWAGALPGLVFILLAIVFGAIGLSRAGGSKDGDAPPR